MQIYRTTLVFIIFFLTNIQVFSSSPLLPAIELKLSGQAGSGENLPFWLFANQGGRYSLDKGALFTSLSATGHSDTLRRFTLSYGVEMAARSDSENQLWIQQGWLQVDAWKLIRLRAGRVEESIGFQHDDLSSGSMLWSGNARPITRIEIGSAGFVDVPFTKGYLQLKGNLTHGWMEPGRYVENVLLHQKYLYGRIGGDLPFTFTYGLHHVALWGGHSPIFGKLPDGLDTYFRVFFAREGNADDPNTPITDVINSVGNSIGSRSYAFDYTFERSKAGIYYQDVFEDNSGKIRRNFPDGLWGIFWESKREKPVVKSILYEFVHTTHQSGPAHNIGDSMLMGDDNYFNHATYKSGWTYYGLTIGTPFITSPQYQRNIDHPLNLSIWNTRVRAHHAGLTGYVPLRDVLYRILFSYSINEGVYGSNSIVPEIFEFTEPRYQFSWFMELLKTIGRNNNLLIKVAVGRDWGTMYKENFGGRVTLVWKLTPTYLN